MLNNKPFSQACQRNQEPILGALKQLIGNKHNILFEVGSGTGQHAVYMAPYFPHMTWQTSDLQANHKGITMWLDEANISNIHKPLLFEAGNNTFPISHCDIIYTANSLHIMSWQQVKSLVEVSGTVLTLDGLFIIYGPFNYHGQYTSLTNKDFDQWLKEKNSNSAIRNFEDVNQTMQQHGLILQQDISMPANNRLLVFKKSL